MLRVLAVAFATLAALPYSVVALAQDFRYGAVLGELILVPVCAFVLALVAAYRNPWVVQLRPGRADYVTAGAAFLVAALLFTVASIVAGNAYYALRPDLLALPAVAAGAVCLLFGVRALVAFGPPILLAALSWPVPVAMVVEPAGVLVTAATTTAVEAILQVLPLAVVVPGAGDLRLTVAAPQGSFDVLVASACSGIAGITGMLLVATAAQYVLHGSWRRRVAWVVSAALVAWILNLVRIITLLAVGRAFGEQAALGLLHTVAGLLLLNLGFAALVWVAPRFGLTFSLRPQRPADTPLTQPAPVASRMGNAALTRRAVVLVLCTGFLALLNTVVPDTAIAFNGNQPAAISFRAAPTPPSGYRVATEDEKRWARRYFGSDSTWLRYRLAPVSADAKYSIWLDAITTSDWSSLRAHPVLDCYRFHGFELLDVRRTVLGAGVLADQVVYSRPDDGATWHVLSWEWPVREAEGRMVHERVTLLASSWIGDRPPATSDGSGGLRGLLARTWAEEAGSDPNPAVAAALRDSAESVIAMHLLDAPRTSEEVDR